MNDTLLIWGCSIALFSALMLVSQTPAEYGDRDERPTVCATYCGMQGLSVKRNGPCVCERSER